MEARTKTSISAQISPEIYERGKKSGLRWGYLVELGLETIDLRFQRNELVVQIDKLQRANSQLQQQIFKLQDELDTKKAEAGP